jgi:uncharacterized protein YydD (DUF2326 family)
MAKYGKAKYGMTKYGSSEPNFITFRDGSDLENDSIYSYINYNDLNRIESRIREVSERLNELDVPNSVTSYEWSVQTESNLSENLPTLEKTQRIIDNVNTLYDLIKSNFDGFTGENLCPKSMRFMTLQKMNELESTLYQMNKFLKGVSI